MNRILKYGAVAGAITAILVLAGMLGADLIPWPAKAQVEALQDSQAASIVVQQKLIERLDRSDRRYWRDMEIQAEAELQANPNSVSAKRELKRAQDAIDALDREAME